MLGELWFWTWSSGRQVSWLPCDRAVALLSGETDSPARLVLFSVLCLITDQGEPMYFERTSFRGVDPQGRTEREHFSQAQLGVFAQVALERARALGGADGERYSLTTAVAEFSRVFAGDTRTDLVAMAAQAGMPVHTVVQQLVSDVVANPAGFLLFDLRTGQWCESE